MYQYIANYIAIVNLNIFHEVARKMLLYGYSLSSAIQLNHLTSLPAG